MKLTTFLKENKLDKKKLEPIIAKVIRDEYPMLSGLSDYQTAEWVDLLDLRDQEMINFICKLARYTKLWSFS